MTDCWIEECKNCGKSTMVGSYGDNCQFCGKNVSKKEVIMVTKNSEERRPVPEKPKKPNKGKKLEAYWENNKTDILADYYSMSLSGFLKRWAIAPITWQALKKPWGVRNKTGNKAGPRETPNPGGVALEAVNLAKHTEHEKYLVLLGYQTAVREMLNIIPENPPNSSK